MTDALWNPVPRCLAVSLHSPANSSEEETVVVAEVRCGTSVLEDEDNDAAYEFGLSKAVIEITNSGCSIKPGPRQGDHKVKYKIKAKSSAKSKATLVGNAGAGTSLSLTKPPSLVVELGGKGAKQEDTTNDLEIEEIFSEINSVGDRHIELSAPPGKLLSGYYLGHEDLCVVTDRDPVAEVTVKACFKPMDLQIIAVERKKTRLFTKDLSRNKIAFACMLVAKALKEKFEEEDVRFSTTEIPIGEATLIFQGARETKRSKTKKTSNENSG